MVEEVGEKGGEVLVFSDRGGAAFFPSLGVVAGGVPGDYGAEMDVLEDFFCRGASLFSCGVLGCSFGEIGFFGVGYVHFGA